MRMLLIAVKEVLSVQDDFCLVLEEDGTVVCLDVVDVIIESDEKIGIIMVLKNGEMWSKKGITFIFFLQF
jgi:hypothetical protein